MISKIFRALILGAPASGKGTISERIVRDFGLKHVSSGDLLRSQVLSKTKAGVELSKYIEKGHLVPDNVMVALITAELSRISTNWLLDGFPRTVSQAEQLMDKEPISVAISLDVPIEVIVDRIKGRWTHIPSGRIYHTEFNPSQVPGIDDITGEKLAQRDDDKPDVVKKRLEVYAENMKPVLDFYRSKEKLYEFHGTKSNEIWPRVHQFLSRHIPAQSGPW